MSLAPTNGAFGLNSKKTSLEEKIKATRVLKRKSL